MTNEDAGKKTDQPRATACVVLGMHRSGTSALAGALIRMGCAGPARLMPPTRDNPKGYYESLTAKELNDCMLQSAGSDWSDWAPLTGWLESAVVPHFVWCANEVLESEFGDAPLFLLKDPRICRLLPVWSQAFAQAGADPVYIHALRHPTEVASSLNAREKAGLLPGVPLWLRHVLDAEATSRGTRRCFVSYDALLRDWRAVVSQIEERTGLAFPRQGNGKAAAEVDAFLTGTLRHHQGAAATDGPDAMLPSHLPAAAKAAWTILKRWTVDGEDPRDHAALDALRAEFDEQAVLLAAVGPTIEMQRKAVEEAVQRERSRQIVRRKRTRRVVYRMVERQREIATRLDEEYRARLSAEAELGDVTLQRGLLQAENSDLTAALDAGRERERAQTAASAELAAEIERLTQKLASHERASADFSADLERLRAEATTNARGHALALVEQRRAFIAESEAVRAAFENSRLWRLSAPLRRLRPRQERGSTLSETANSSR